MKASRLAGSRSKYNYWAKFRHAFERARSHRQVNLIFIDSANPIDRDRALFFEEPACRDLDVGRPIQFGIGDDTLDVANIFPIGTDHLASLFQTNRTFGDVLL